MEPKSAFDGLPAGSQPRTATRMFSFGLVSRFIVAVKNRACRRISCAPCSAWLKSCLLLVAAAFCCLALPGAPPTNTIEFQNSIPPPGSIQWDINHRRYQEQQERYRFRLAVPDVVGTNVPIAAGAYLDFERKWVAAPPASPAISFRFLFRLLLYAALFVLIGGLVLHRFAPQVLAELNQQFNPWAVNPVAERNLSAKVRAEEEAFGEFLATFRVGPSAPPRTDVPEKADPLGEFYARAKQLLGTQRKLLFEIGREAGDPARHKLLKDLCSEMSKLKGEAGVPGALPVWQVASALEGLLKQLTDKLRNVSSSTLRAVNGGLDLLDDLCAPGLKPDLLTDRPFKFLIVDDDLISRQALSLSLKKAFSQPDLAVDGESALVQAGQQAYDVIFLDVEMPGMDGFELCTKIRGTSSNQTTPVVFVTSHNDFDARAESTLSGGNDLMGKPFLMFEVTVKALTLALQGRLQGHVPKPLPKPAPVRDSAVLPLPVVDGPRPVASPAIVPPIPLPTAPALETDLMVKTFLARASKNLGPLQELCATILQTADEEARQSLLADGFLRINSLLPQAGPKVAHPAYQLSIAVEGLFRKLLQDSKNSNPSTLATVAAAVDLLKDLCVPGLKPDLAVNPPVHILVVDDDLVMRRSIVGALQTTFEKPASVESGEAALALLAEKTFDLVFLDVMMPGMDGFETCAKIRETALNRATPVVFVTSLGDFDVRAKAGSNGGDDLMGKPFLTSEINVKALTFALRGRLQELISRQIEVAG